MNFNYNEVYPTKQDIYYNYYVKSNIITENNEETDNKEEILVRTKEYTSNENIVSINVDAVVPFSKYNDYAVKYKNTYGTVDNCDLIVSLILSKNGKYETVASIKVPLDSTFNIEKETIKYFSISFVLSLAFYIVYIIIKLVLLLPRPEYKTNK